MSFAVPQAFLLLIPLGLLLYRQGLPTGLSSILRVAVGLLLVSAVARPSCTAHGGGQDLVVILDRSRSMPPGSDSHAEELLHNLEARAGSHDRVGIVTFGREARVERAPTAHVQFSGFQREIDGNGSDLASALDTAQELIPPDREGRVLVLSDGLATGTDPRNAARRLAQRGVPIDFRLLGRSSTAGDAAVRDLELPRQVAQGEPFQFSATVYSTQERSIPYVLRRGSLVLARGTLNAHRGDNQLTFRDRIDSSGLADYSLELAGLNDTVPENDRGRGIVRVTGTPRVLIVRPDGKPSALVRALQASQFNVEVTAAAPQSLEALDGVGVVVLENTPASALQEQGLEVLARFVRDVGGGLLMTGGRHSFGEGGYHLSALEPVLPVSLELRKEQHRSSVALGISMDRSGSMAVLTPDGRPKIKLAAEGAVGALTLLTKGDEATVWVVDTKAHELFPLTPVEWGLSLDQVASVQSEGGGIYIGEALRAAADELAKAKALTRHLILFADASDSEEPADYRETIARMRRDSITISVIGMGTAHDSDAALLTEIARLGGGQIYFSDRVSELPRLFSEDTIVLSRAAFVDSPVALSIASDLAMLGTLEGNGLPRLGGYNLTYLRPTASVALRTVDDNNAPALAFWQAGLGRAAAFTGEVDGEFTGGLNTWSGFRSLFSRLVRQLMPPPEAGEILTKATREGDDLHVSIEVDDKTAALAANGTATLVSGNGEGTPTTLPLRWEDSHRLGAHFPLGSEGSFFPLVQVAGKALRVAPVALPYPSEFAPRDPAEGHALLAELAQLTGGVERLSVDGILAAPADRAGKRPVTAWFVLSALLVMMSEVALRRLVPAGVPLPRIPLPKVPARPRRPPTVVAEQQPPIRTEEVPPAPPPAEPAKPAADLQSALDQAKDRARRRM